MKRKNSEEIDIKKRPNNDMMIMIYNTVQFYNQTKLEDIKSKRRKINLGDAWIKLMSAR